LPAALSFGRARSVDSSDGFNNDILRCINKACAKSVDTWTISSGDIQTQPGASDAPHSAARVHERRRGTMGKKRSAVGVIAGDAAKQSACDSENVRRIEKLPREVGVLLIAAGLGGILLPGPIGSPFLIMGGIALWPRAFRGVERAFERRFPRAYRQGMRQVTRFLDDLERRYPLTQ
jgi:hypothetical protein